MCSKICTVPNKYYKHSIFHGFKSKTFPFAFFLFPSISLPPGFTFFNFRSFFALHVNFISALTKSPRTRIQQKTGTRGGRNNLYRMMAMKMRWESKTWGNRCKGIYPEVHEVQLLVTFSYSLSLCQVKWMISFSNREPNKISLNYSLFNGQRYKCKSCEK